MHGVLQPGREAARAVGAVTDDATMAEPTGVGSRGKGSDFGRRAEPGAPAHLPKTMSGQSWRTQSVDFPEAQGSSQRENNE